MLVDDTERCARCEGIHSIGFPGSDVVWFLRRQGGVLQVVVVADFGLGRRDVADGLEQASMVEPVDPVEGGELTVSSERQGPRRRITSVSSSPITLSARALSQRSPTLPTDGSMPASASRSV